MTKKSSTDSEDLERNKRFLIGLLRALAGALIFSFPILMTMEMWSLGYTISPYRLILLIIFSMPVLIGLSHFVGFKDTENIADDIIDAFVGYFVGFLASAILLYIFGIIDSTMSYYEIIGKITIQTITAAIGAMLAQSELGGNDNDSSNENSKKERKDRAGYWSELFLMLVGAIFLAMSPAPTEEMYLIAFKMSEWQIILLALISILTMHAFVYTVGFEGQEKEGKNSPFWVVFLRFTIVGYAIALLISLYLLWTFGSLDGMGLKEIIEVTIVLGFPAALGAAASRVIL
ncbi:MAG: TIGR02587 family membrane protein [Aridibacter sp.]